MSTAYHEMVIEGAKGRTYGFVEGYLVASEMTEPIFNAEKEGFDCESLRERLRELLHLSEEVIHLLVPEPMVAVVQAAVTAAGERDLEVTIHSTRPISGARFGFQLNIFSREHAAKIRSIFENPPPGARLSAETEFEEIVRPDAKGVEAYAPEHHYELKASGTVEGDLAGVVTLHRQCRQEELVTLESLTLDFPDEAP